MERLLPLCGVSSMNFDVIAYGSGDMLRMVFTAIASIFGNADYKAAMQTAGLLGFVAVLFKAAFDRDAFANFRWLIATLVLIMALLVPKTTVIVNDRIVPANSAVVNNVPIGLAATASFFSFTGDWLARSFETVFSMPNEVKYTTSGMLFPHKLYAATRKMNFPDDRTSNNFTEFFASCVVVDGIGHNRFTWREVMSAPNLMNFFDTRVAVNAASFKYTAGSGNESILPCRSGFTNTLKPEMLSLYTNIIQYGVQGGLIARFDGATNAANRMQADMQNSMNFMTGVSISPQQLVTQQAIINEMGRGVHKLSQQTNATEFNDYIVSGANTSRLTTYQALGDIASEKLPLLRTIFEIIIYAIFPIIVLMAIVLPGKVPMAYVSALVWINLWAPMYAILHFIMSYYSQATMTEISGMYGGGFSVFANTEMEKFNSDVVATAGYLGTALPMLAWMLVSRSGAMAASLAGRVMQGYDQSVEKGTNEIMAGEGQRFGNKFEQTGSGNIQNTALMDSGSKLTTTADGTALLSQTTSQLMVDPKITEQSMQSSQQAVENATANQQMDRATLNEATNAVLQSSGAVMDQLRTEQGASDNFKSAETAQQQENVTAMKTAADEWAKSQGIDLTDTTSGRLYGAIEGQIKATVGTPGEGLFGSGISNSVTVKGGGTLEGSTSEAERDASMMAEKFMESDQYRSLIGTIGTGVSELAGTYGVGETNSSVDQLNASLGRQETAQRDYIESVTETQTAKDTLTATENLSAALSVNGGQTLVNSLLAANNGDAGKVDALIRAAAGGSGEAMEAIRFALVDGDQRYGMQNDENFRQVQDLMLQDGRGTVDSTYNSGRGDVVTQGDEWREAVDGLAPISSGEVREIVGLTREAQQEAMHDPGSVVSTTGTSMLIDYDNYVLTSDGARTQERVETMAVVVEDAPLPFAGTTMNEGMRDNKMEELRENMRERRDARSGG